MLLNNRPFEHFIENIKIPQLSPSRERLLQQLAFYISEKERSGKIAQLNFICTHNSRRSQFAQVWAFVFSRYLKLPIQVFSGGTEATSVHSNVINTLLRTGFKVVKGEGVNNPHYNLIINDQEEIELWSKTFEDSSNPNTGFAAIMVCSDADEACPFVPGSETRIALPFSDPKVADDTAAMEETYLKSCTEIAEQLLYAFKLALELINK